MAAKQTRQLSDEDLTRLYAADPHAVTSTKPWELELRSPFLKKVAIGWVVVVMAVHIFMGAVVDAGFTGLDFTLVDKLAFPGIGVIISALSYVALTRPRVRVNADGVEVRNIIGTRFYPWLVIYGLSFPRSARMARLELPEFEYVPLWAIQAADGKGALAAVDKFRALEAAYMPES
ncbi:PH domain-containing protein [Corynebacterium liangguodongii]|uniref:Uncharacterized protein n=1 Tax=Corynebacterium liangguodongii TaxID=2079535 RepID=A0A2S0WE65_9CORY|nr:PH domain-containing protein [Corynebacterium liangguodongii]AWB84061.1 hypothetical protein C3E79_05865 [Corynebacterium liangguodongii]PWC00072.1 PH domain-containing protein [Corynebacterium liangguodongii]